MLENNVSILYDETAQAPYFRYTDANNKEHEVWFEDARSIQAKFNLIKELNLNGIAYWKLGLSFPQNWLLLSDQFNIEKERHRNSYALSLRRGMVQYTLV